MPKKVYHNDLILGSVAGLFLKDVIDKELSFADEVCESYVSAGKRAAHTLRIPYVDVYDAFSKKYSDKTQYAFYADKWHPGAYGYEIYYKEIKKLDCISALCSR